MNAIIVAAGLGTRFKELTKHTHKSLLPINGIPNLERTIRMLNQADIHEIHIITGYLASQFDYLVKKFPGVQTHYNDKYESYNSIYTFSKALPYFGDSFVIDADSVLKNNVFNFHPQESCYFTILRTIHGTEWCPITNDSNRVTHIEVTDKHIPSMSGISFWSESTANDIKSVYPNYMQDNVLTQKQLYWDTIPTKLFKKIVMRTHQVSEDSMYEMDTQENYKTIQKLLSTN